MIAPEARALLALIPEIPRATGPDPERLMITLRSSRTLAELVADQGWDTTDPDTRWQHGAQIDAAEANPHGYWEQAWPLTAPTSAGWAQDWTIEQWAAHAAAQFPAGFYPVAVGRPGTGGRTLPEALADEIRDELRSGSLDTVRQAADKVRVAGRALEAAQAHRDRAIRAALAAGVPATDVAEAAGVNRSRVYQLRGTR
jgi:hypothetical protein